MSRIRARSVERDICRSDGCRRRPLVYAEEREFGEAIITFLSPINKSYMDVSTNAPVPNSQKSSDAPMAGACRIVFVVSSAGVDAVVLVPGS